MGERHTLTCRCGAFRAELLRPERGFRAVCYCRDCQSFGRFLGEPAGMMDPLGGTEVLATSPRNVAFVSGTEQLACMSLSPSGTLRWFTRCCRTPIGNTPRDWRIAHLSLIRPILGGDEASLERRFGPVRMRANRESARGEAPRASRLGTLLTGAGFAFRLAWARLSGGYRDNPWFRADGQPQVVPEVVSREERERLRAVPPLPEAG